MQKNYLEKVYSGFLGMNIGIRLGAPVESTVWTYERIKNTYGNITDYVKEYKNFAADDDANGPVFFLRALYDIGNRELTPQDVARAWLNYTREEKGMFWWGGYGVSTEHTAYQNIKMGIDAPMSGSIKQNGVVLAEQIGGQIFIDTWGLIFPNNPEKAALYGEYAASVSHDGDGINGARFFCAAIAKAFSCSDIKEIIDSGLSFIPDDSNYYKVSHAVLDFHKENPDDFRACRDMLERNWGYDKYFGVCHIIPNAGVCILSMVYGDGCFNKTVEIATMCGWDTDCNAGNVGTVLGVMCGVDGIDKKYRKPINDSIVLSSISGYLNILDIPTYSKELAILGYKMAKEDIPQYLSKSFKMGEIYFDFELPGSTHNIRVSDNFFCSVMHTTEKSYSGDASLKILIDRMNKGDKSKVFYKPYYLRSDFSDERYSPVFSPTVYSGQSVSLKLFLDIFTGNDNPAVTPFIHLANQNKDIVMGYIRLENNEWVDIQFTIPDSEGDLIDEVGIIIEGYSGGRVKTLANVYLDEFRVYGNYEYTIDFSKQKVNFGAVSPFSHNYGAWQIFENQLSAMSCGYTESYAGNYFGRDYEIESEIIPENGDSHLLSIRSQGAKRGYHAGLASNNELAIYKNHFGITKLVSSDFNWKFNRSYLLKLKAVSDEITLFVDGEKKLSIKDSDFEYGMYGCAKLTMGRTLFGNFRVKGYM